MKLALALPLVALLAAQPPTGTGVTVDPTPTWAERLAFNPRERTAHGLAERESERPAEAAAALDAALRLAPADPLAGFNAGTARLEAGVEGAEELLARAAESAPTELAPVAFYNLGNARLAGRDARGAIEAYRETLRRSPDHAAAKHNLELALRQLEQQQQQQQQQPPQQQSQDQERQQPEPERSEDPTGGDEPQPQPEPSGEPAAEEGPPDPQPGQRPLPQFEDQPDMSAEQAAAILQSVENLERQHRRDQASEQARTRGKVVKDW